MKRINCNTCTRPVRVDADGFLANHKRGGFACSGSGRHIDFVQKGKPRDDD
jgi:hypothetical protein